MRKKLLVAIIAAAVILTVSVCASLVIYADNTPEASIGDTDYATFEDALAAVSARGTITLNKDVTISSTIIVSKNLTIASPEGKQYKITYTGGGMAINVEAGVTFKLNNTIVESTGGGVKIGGADAEGRLGSFSPTNSKIIASGTSGSSACIVFTAEGGTLNSINTDMSAKWYIVYAAECSNVKCTFDGGTYEMTGSYQEGLLKGDGTGGRFIQLTGATASGSSITFNSGNFIAHCGYVFNFTQRGCEIKVNGGNFFYDGKDFNLMIFKDDSNLTIYGGVFNTPYISTAISTAAHEIEYKDESDKEQTRVGVPKTTVYGGTFFVSGGSAISAGSITYGGVKYSASLTSYGGAFFDVKNGVEMDLSDVKPQRLTGASVSLDSANPGIRFDTVITANTMKEVRAKIDSGTDLKFGTLIVKTSVIKSLGEKNSLLSGVNGFNFDIIAAAGLKDGVDYTDYRADGLILQADGNYRIYAIHKVTDANDYDDEFSAVAYIKYTMGGKDYYIYSNYNDGSTRSMKDIAHRALADYDANPGKFSYTADQLALLKTYDADINIESNVYMTAKVLSLNILTHEAGDRNYAYYGENKQSGSNYTFAKRFQYVKAMFEYAQPDVMLFQEYSGKSYWGTAINLQPCDAAGGSGNTAQKNSGYFYTASNAFEGYVWVNHQNRRGILYKDNTASYMKNLGYGDNAFHAHNFVVFDSNKFTYIASNTEFVSKSGYRDYDQYPYHNQQGGVQYDKDSLKVNTGGASATVGTTSPQDDLGDYTWVVLEDKATGLRAVYASIHTYNGSIQKYAYMLDNLQCLTERLEEISEQYGGIPVIVGGDFNLTQGIKQLDRCYDHMVNVAHYTDSWITGSNSGTARSFGGSRNGGNGSSRHGSRIDYIFVNGAETYGYEVMNGQVKYSGGKWVYDPYAVLDSGDSFDISDHLPLFTEVIIGNTDDYGHVASESSDKYFRNQNTLNDTSTGANITGITGATVNSSDKYGSQFVSATKVTTGGVNAWRVMATDETNHVNVTLSTGSINLTSVSKIRITYKTEMTLNFVSRPTDIYPAGEGGRAHIGVDLRFKVGSNYYVMETSTNGEWKTIEIDVSALKTTITGIDVYGRYNATGLCNGDAVYISSIEFIG